MRKRVGVIGAGPSGLITIKELKEQGHDVIGFELQPDIGGTYVQHYEQLQLTTSSLNISFGAFAPGGEHAPSMWTSWEYLRYLGAFADRFDLLSCIHFSSQVNSLWYDEQEGAWHLRAVPHPPNLTHPNRSVPPAATPSPSSPGQPLSISEEFVFDHVAVCSGTNTLPRWPDWPYIERFVGKILHSSQFSRAEEITDRRVLVVGLGESGSDIALQVASKASASAVSTRNGPGYVIPRFYRSLPSDVDTNRCYHAIPRWLCAHPLVRFKVRIEKLLLGPDDDRLVLAKADEFNRNRGYSPFHRFSTKNTAFVEAILYHDMQYCSEVAYVEERGVVFTDGTGFECDVIVCCTGFGAGFPFLEPHHPMLAEQGADARRLYKHMLIPSLGAKLAWIGFVRPGVGAIPPCAELQARYFASLVSGEQTLPSIASMRDDIRDHATADYEQYSDDAERLPALTDYLRFLDGMAELIGCRPPLGRLFWRAPRTWLKVLFAPICGAQYRLVGPGAEPDRARQVLHRAPTMPWPVLAYEFFVLLASKSLYLLGFGERFKPLGF